MTVKQAKDNRALQAGIIISPETYILSRMTQTELAAYIQVRLQSIVQGDTQSMLGGNYNKLYARGRAWPVDNSKFLFFPLADDFVFFVTGPGKCLIVATSESQLIKIGCIVKKVEIY